jgi:hypothetical protein
MISEVRGPIALRFWPTLCILPEPGHGMLRNVGTQLPLPLDVMQHCNVTIGVYDYGLHCFRCHEV